MFVELTCQGWAVSSSAGREKDTPGRENCKHRRIGEWICILCIKFGKGYRFGKCGDSTDGVEWGAWDNEGWGWRSSPDEKCHE